jgi:hypothetical protein
MADVPLPSDPVADTVVVDSSNSTLPTDISGQSLQNLDVGPVETDNYTEGGTFSDSGGYPVSVNPAEIVHELVVIQVGNDIVLDLETTTGATLNGVNLNGSSAVIDTLALDSFTFRDPSATDQAVSGFWVGEPHE